MLFDIVLLAVLVIAMSTGGCILAGPTGYICGALLAVFMYLMAATPGGLIIGVIALIAAGLAIERHYELLEEKKNDDEG